MKEIVDIMLKTICRADDEQQMYIRLNAGGRLCKAFPGGKGL